jgi:CDP-glycerol glycerophosphotransferase (TagB/SpsB family)
MRVGFFHAYAFHHAMLDPVARAIGGDATCLHADDVASLVRFQPDVVVLAEHAKNHLQPLLPGVPIVWTRHGFAVKNYTAESLDACDYACLSSEWVRTDFHARGWRARRDEWITGFAPMDALWQALREPRANGAPTLLYAPTHNPTLTSLNRLGNNWGPRLRAAMPQLRVVIKLHPHSPDKHPLWCERLRQWAANDPGIDVIDDVNSDIYPLLAHADVLLTDASSVMFYWLALDRPLILVDSPHRFGDAQRYSPDGYEWQWRNMGERIESGGELIPAVQRAFASPQAHATARALYRQRLFGDSFDGHVAQRVARHVLELAA